MCCATGVHIDMFGAIHAYKLIVCAYLCVSLLKREGNVVFLWHAQSFFFSGRIFKEFVLRLFVRGFAVSHSFIIVTQKS